MCQDVVKCIVMSVQAAHGEVWEEIIISYDNMPMSHQTVLPNLVLPITTHFASPTVVLPVRFCHVYELSLSDLQYYELALAGTECGAGLAQPDLPNLLVLRFSFHLLS